MDKKSPRQVKKEPNGCKSVRFKCDYSITPLKVLQARGWTRVTSAKDPQWDLWWCDTSELKQALDGLIKLRPQQKVSHFRNHCELTRKNYLYRNLKRYKRLLLKASKTREAELCNAMPITFELPGEYRMLVEEYRKKPGATWIVKPVAGSQGRGIFLFQRLKDLMDWRAKEWITNIDPSDMDFPMYPETYVVQRYIDDPYLIAGCKFDLRLYVLVTSFQPLKVWLAREGFARLSGEQFSLECIDDCRIHLTNMSIQLRPNNIRNNSISKQSSRSSSDASEEKADETSVEQEEEEASTRTKLGRKWPLSSLKQYLTARHGAPAVEELLRNIAAGELNENKSQTNATHDEKNEETTLNGHSEKQKKTKRRLKTLRIGWLHKMNSDIKYRSVKKPLGGVQRLKLDESISYSTNDIKKMAVEAFNSYVKKFTLEDRFEIHLGFFDGRTISDFKLRNGATCDIWCYCSSQNKPLYQLNLFILTTLRDEEDADIVFGVQQSAVKQKKSRSRRRRKRKDNVSVYYSYERTSKYSNELTYMECRKSDLHTYVLEENCGDVPPIDQFDPLDYGHPICKIEKSGKILLQITKNDDSTKKSFAFPSAKKSQNADHSIIHDIDELQGIYSGFWGVGLIPSCTDACRPVFTWYRDGEMFKQSEFLYWLSDLRDDGKEHVWSCSVKCKENENELKSKEISLKT